MTNSATEHASGVVRIYTLFKRISAKSYQCHHYPKPHDLFCLQYLKFLTANFVCF